MKIKITRWYNIPAWNSEEQKWVDGIYYVNEYNVTKFSILTNTEYEDRYSGRDYFDTYEFRSKAKNIDQIKLLQHYLNTSACGMLTTVNNEHVFLNSDDTVEFNNKVYQLKTESDRVVFRNDITVEIELEEL